MVPEGVVC